jgi:hypothetical protein
MKSESTTHQLAEASSSWISSIELGAGIYLLDGRTHMAGHSSPAERALLERGAMLVASVRFDRDPHERYHDAHSVRLLEAEEAIGWLTGLANRG